MFATTNFFQTTLHVAQIAFGSFFIYQGCISIMNLLQHEKNAKEAAKWPQTAACQLRETVATQTFGALSVSSLRAAAAFVV